MKIPVKCTKCRTHASTKINTVSDRTALNLTIGWQFVAQNFHTEFYKILTQL
jgi:hypothetical protein